jgi:hypothetical protein
MNTIEIFNKIPITSSENVISKYMESKKFRDKNYTFRKI